MRIGVISDNWIESLALRANWVADPLIKTNLAFIMARSIMVAVEIGLFEALVDGPKTADEVASICGSRKRPTQSLLAAMVSCDYLSFLSSSGHYSLSPLGRKWLTRASPDSVCNKMLLQNLEWNFMNGLFDYVKDGKAVDLHLSGSADTWQAYQKGMADLGKIALDEVVQRLPLPKAATALLDIGGSGGTYSAAFVKRHQRLSATILDLPQAVEYARDMVNAHGLPPERLAIRAGNVLDEDLGSEGYDFVFMANVAHHLSDGENRAVAAKVKTALKPGGVYCILEPTRTDSPSRSAQFGALCDLYFGLTSRSGTWSVAEMSAWMASAGLRPGKPIALRTAPGAVMVHAKKDDSR
jgi:2-polyprenyl-3-methyl-5-hydroxy-6-metoxy-1,4-benzoquinol methylase